MNEGVKYNTGCYLVGIILGIILVSFVLLNKVPIGTVVFLGIVYFILVFALGNQMWKLIEKLGDRIKI